MAAKMVSISLQKPVDDIAETLSFIQFMESGRCPSCSVFCNLYGRQMLWNVDKGLMVRFRFKWGVKIHRSNLVITWCDWFLRLVSAWTRCVFTLQKQICSLLLYNLQFHYASVHLWSQEGVERETSLGPQMARVAILDTLNKNKML